jgi:hypothetical protein
VAHGLLAVANDLLQLIENYPVFCDLNISNNNKIIEVEHKEDIHGVEEKNQNESEYKNNSSELESQYKMTVRNVSIKEKLDSIVIKSLKESFQKTDDEFIKTSAHPQHGSTATTALILGNLAVCYIYIYIYMYIYILIYVWICI